MIPHQIASVQVQFLGQIEGELLVPLPEYDLVVVF